MPSIDPSSRVSFTSQNNKTYAQLKTSDGEGRIVEVLRDPTPSSALGRVFANCLNIYRRMLGYVRQNVSTGHNTAEYIWIKSTDLQGFRTITPTRQVMTAILGTPEVKKPLAEFEGLFAVLSHIENRDGVIDHLKTAEASPLIDESRRDFLKLLREDLEKGISPIALHLQQLGLSADSALLQQIQLLNASSSPDKEALQQVSTGLRDILDNNANQSQLRAIQNFSRKIQMGERLCAALKKAQASIKEPAMTNDVERANEKIRALVKARLSAMMLTYNNVAKFTPDVGLATLESQIDSLERELGI